MRVDSSGLTIGSVIRWNGDGGLNDRARAGRRPVGRPRDETTLCFLLFSCSLATARGTERFLGFVRSFVWNDVD